MVVDPGAAGGKALAQLDEDRTENHFPLLVYDGMTAKDLDVRVSFNAMAGEVDRAGGLAPA
jgi:hypothetical protein